MSRLTKEFMKEYKLCYVEDDRAYFTKKDLVEQWGDDWDDIPYEHNAEEPYHDKDNPILVVHFDPRDWKLPGEGELNSAWSVFDINNYREFPWLHRETESVSFSIYAGTSLLNFLSVMDTLKSPVSRIEIMRGDPVPYECIYEAGESRGDGEISMKEYKTVVAIDSDQFDKEVNRAVGDGWSLSGNLVMCAIPNALGFSAPLAQRMERDIKEDHKDLIKDDVPSDLKPYLDSYFLCFVNDEGSAYFTTIDLSKQCGPNWDEKGYEHVAGVPYYSSDEPILAVDFWFKGWVLPGSEYKVSDLSVCDINRLKMDWLTKSDSDSNKDCAITAGCSLRHFLSVMKSTDTGVYAIEIMCEYPDFKRLYTAECSI